jgi:hypothetical protein
MVILPPAVTSAKKGMSFSAVSVVNDQPPAMLSTYILLKKLLTIVFRGFHAKRCCSGTIC